MLNQTTLCHDCGSTLVVCAEPTCGKPFPRRVREDDKSWRARKFCSTTCAEKFRQARRSPDAPDVQRKPCENPRCDKQSVQRHNETGSSFAKRKYCSHECASDVRRGTPVPNFEPSRMARKAAVEAKGKTSRPKRPAERKREEEAVKKPLIRKDVPVVRPEPPAEPTVWRPAAWRAMDKQRAG